MVYNTSNHWVSGLCPSYGILNTKSHLALYLQKLALTSPISGGRSVSIVRSRTKATELVRCCHLVKMSQYYTELTVWPDKFFFEQYP
jgi:hypothetical protein